MKIGCCVNMVASKPDATGAEWIEKLGEYGFNYVELPLSELTAISNQDFRAILVRLEQSGIRCEACNNFFPKTMRLTGAEVDIHAISAYLQRALDRAYALGVERIVFGSGPAKHVPTGFPKQDGYKQVVELLQSISGALRGSQVTVAIEPLNKRECNLINTFQEGCQLAADVCCDNIRVLVDYYHLCEENEPVSHLVEQGKTYLRHVHFSRHQGRGYPASAAEDARYARFFQALRAVEYDQRISIEAYAEDFAAQAPNAVQFIRKQFRKG